MLPDPPPPPPPQQPPPDRRGGLKSWERAVVVVLVALVGLFIVFVFVIFNFGEDLFGSDRGTIDSYNRDILDTCEVPEDSTLVRTFVLGLTDSSGQPFRSMSYVYASPLDADELAAFYGLDGPGTVVPVSPERACRFGQRPQAVVVSLWTPEDGDPLEPATQTAGLPADPLDAFWAGPEAEVTDLADVPSGTRSFLRLRLAQREEEGVFGLGDS